MVIIVCHVGSLLSVWFYAGCCSSISWMLFILWYWCSGERLGLSFVERFIGCFFFNLLESADSWCWWRRTETSTLTQDVSGTNYHHRHYTYWLWGPPMLLTSCSKLSGNKTSRNRSRWLSDDLFLVSADYTRQSQPRDSQTGTGRWLIADRVEGLWWRGWDGWGGNVV